MSKKPSTTNNHDYLKMMRMYGSSSSSQPSTDPNQQPASSSFLKIPRIRLNKSNNKHAKSPPEQSTPPHLVNTHVALQQQNNHNNNQIRFTAATSHANHHQQQMKMIREELLKRGGEGEEEGDDGEVVRGAKVLIKPKKLPNPIKESVAMQSVHKELLLNQKIGRSVLTHKTELQKALEKLAASKLDEDDEQHPPTSPTPSSSIQNPQPPVPMPARKKDEFQRILESRAKLIEEQKCIVDGESREDAVAESEFEMIHKRIVRQ